MAFSVLLVGIILSECSSLQTKYKKLNTEYKKLEKENIQLKEKINPTKDVIDSLIEMEKEPLQSQLDTHKENTLKVYDQLFVEKEAYPSFYNSKGVTRDFNFLAPKNAYTVVFEKGGTVMGTNKNRDTLTFTSPKGATVHLDRNNRVTEVRGIVYKSRY